MSAGTAHARRSVGGYEIVGELARGGMAIVHLARQPSLDREVALKELAAFPVAQTSLAERFLLESRVSGSLKSEHVVQVYDYLEQDGVPYIAMEYLERGSLRPYAGRLTLSQIAGVLEGVLSGLAHAHAHGIVHRDLKPENILVTREGTVKIADFGIAKAISSVSAHLTATGTTVGTPRYMAPEQAQAKPLGAWTDLYSVGVIAYELMLGRVPFDDDEQPWAVLLRHISEPVPDPRELEPGFDSGLAEWLLWLLAKDPLERPRSARDAWDQLENVVVAREGSFWRRNARLIGAAPEPGPAGTPQPLSSAEFPSVAGSYLTYHSDPGLRRPPTPAPEFGRAAAPPPAQAIQSPNTEARPQLGAATGGPTVAPHHPPSMEPEGGPERSVAPSPLPGRRSRRRRFVAAGAAGLAVVLIGAVAALSLGGSPPPPAPPAAPTLSAKPVEAAVRAELEPLNEVQAVHCPPRIPLRAGLAIDCKVTLRGGQELSVTIRQTGARGQVVAEPHI